jgi:NADPH:quinone reductase-like Zn-dependent oxidoreductase
MRPTQHLLNSIALYGTVVVYSGMSGKPAMVSNPQIIFQSQSVRGFWTLNWFKSPNPEKIKALYEELAAMVASEVISIQTGVCPPCQRCLNPRSAADAAYCTIPGTR